MTDGTSADEQTQRPADSIPVETKEASQIATATTINAAEEAKAAQAGVQLAAADPASQSGQDPDRKVKRLDPWAEQRISEEAFHRREEARARKVAETENERLRAELARLQQSQQDQQPTQPNPQAPAVSPQQLQQFQVSPQDFDRAVDAAAAQRAARAQFDSDCNKVHAEGVAAYKDFDDALKNLGALGALNEQTLQLVIETGDAARLLYELGSDPQEATKVLSLPPARLAVELGKRAAIKPQAKPAAAVSQAPTPIKPVEGSARVSAEPRDDEDDATYFQKRMAQKYGR